MASLQRKQEESFVSVLWIDNWGKLHLPQVSPMAEYKDGSRDLLIQPFNITKGWQMWHCCHLPCLCPQAIAKNMALFPTEPRLNCRILLNTILLAVTTNSQVLAWGVGWEKKVKNIYTHNGQGPAEQNQVRICQLFPLVLGRGYARCWRYVPP